MWFQVVFGLAFSSVVVEIIDVQNDDILLRNCFGHEKILVAAAQTKGRTEYAPWCAGRFSRLPEHQLRVLRPCLFCLTCVDLGYDGTIEMLGWFAQRIQVPIVITATIIRVPYSKCRYMRNRPFRSMEGHVAFSRVFL